MTENPYAGDFADEPGVYDEPPRTSALAVSSLVLSLICCLPVLPLLGAGLGVGALIGIGGSRGRVGGRGMAIAGIIIGVLVTIAQVAAFYSAKGAIDMGVGLVFGSVDSVMTDIESGDYDAARAGLTGHASSLSDERFEAFRAAYQAEYGSFQSVPTDLWGGLIPAYAQMGQQMQNYQQQGSQQNVVPSPATFDSGLVLVIAELDQSGQPTGQPGTPDFKMPLRNIRVVLPDGSELDLIAGPTAPVVPSAPDAGAGDPDDEEPGDDEPSEEHPDDDGGP